MKINDNYLALCNNAAWCMSEFCMAYSELMTPYCNEIAQKLIGFFKNNE